MGEFSYEALKKTGGKVRGVLNAKSETEALMLLRMMGLYNPRIKGGRVVAAASANSIFKGLPKFKLPRGRVSDADLAVFTKQLSVMVDAGVSIVQALNLLSEQAATPAMREALVRTRELVEGGFELGDAMEKSPDAFDKLYVSLIRAGTASGQLDQMLKRLSTYIEKASKLRRQLISALSYPVIILGLAAIMTTVMLLFVVPMFAKNYEDSGKTLPDLTLFVMNASDFMKNNFVHMIVGIILFAVGFKKWRATPNGTRRWDAFVLKLPVFGNLISKVCIARFASTMATLIVSGISIIEALEVCGKAAGNKVLQDEIMKIREDVAQGKGLAVPMSRSKYFPQMVSSMVSIGEQSGRLDQMLEKISSFFEDEVDTAMAAALKMIEPAMFVIIGGIVGFILIAMYLPVFDLASTSI